MAIAGIPGLSQISQAATALSNLALITPSTNFGYQPFNSATNVSAGPSFLFNYEKENKVKLSAETTDNYLGDNTAVNDHTVKRPEIITVSAVIGEVTLIAPALSALAGVAQPVLALISTFAPSFSTSAMNVINETNAAYTEASNAVNGAIGAWNSLTGNGGPNIVNSFGEQISANQNAQQAMFSQIYGYWANQVNPDAPTLWQVQTPWSVFQTCILLDCEVTQDEETEMLTEFKLTFKMLRFVNDGATGLISAGRAANLAASVINNGSVVPNLFGNLAADFPTTSQLGI